MPSLVDPLPAGAFTLTGKTTGPAAPLGRNRYGKSQLMFIGEQELRDVMAHFGWANDKDHALLEREHEELKAAHDELQAKHDELVEKIVDLEKALGWKPEAVDPKPAPKKRTPAKAT